MKTLKAIQQSLRFKEQAARVRTLAAYRDFLTLWKDANPDIPILKQAKSDYAKAAVVNCREQAIESPYGTPKSKGSWVPATPLKPFVLILVGPVGFEPTTNRL